MKFLINLQTYQLYLLQLENYELFRYWRLLVKRHFWPKSQQRKALVWTGKAVAVFGLAEILAFLFATCVVWVLRGKIADLWSVFIAVGVFVCLQVVQFVFFSLAVALLLPVDYIVKKFLALRARNKLADFSNLKIIGVAGSYGKTTMKEILRHVLAVKFAVAATPESVNTPVGIARWILKEVSRETQVLVVEMGEHYRGDVAEICSLAKPDIAVVTGINEAHLERLKHLETAIETIFEIVTHAKAGADIFLNGDDANVVENYSKFVWPDHQVEFYKKTDLSPRRFVPAELCWEAGVPQVGQVKIFLLGEYVLGDISAVVKLAKSLGLSAEEIKKGVEKIRPIEHRLQPIQSAADVLVIDDAYNGNSAGVAEAIKVLSRFPDRRRIYITPGLVETGKRVAGVHTKIGQELASVADLVILIQNSVTPYIAEGLAEEGYSKEKILWYKTAPEAHEDLKNILKPGDVILFQNDWGDQYL